MPRADRGSRAWHGGLCAAVLGLGARYPLFILHGVCRIREAVETVLDMASLGVTRGDNRTGVCVVLCQPDVRDARARGWDLKGEHHFRTRGRGAGANERAGWRILKDWVRGRKTGSEKQERTEARWWGVSFEEGTSRVVGGNFTRHSRLPACACDLTLRQQSIPPFPFPFPHENCREKAGAGIGEVDGSEFRLSAGNLSHSTVQRL